MRSLCYENQFSFILKLELIIITKVSHLDSLWKRDWGELGNGLFFLFMVIYGNLVRWGYNWNRQKPSLSCPRLFLWTLKSFQIGHFRVHLSLHFKARLSAKSMLWKSVFIHIEIGTNYHNKNFALGLALKERLRGTRKWPIYCMEEIA